MSTASAPSGPDIVVDAFHTGNWEQGDINRPLTITVTNRSGSGPTTGVINMAVVPTGGVTLTSISGTDWIGDTAQSKASTSVVLQAGQSTVVTFFYSVSVGAASTALFECTANTAGEANAGNNKDSDSVIVAQSNVFVNYDYVQSFTFARGSSGSGTYGTVPPNNNFIDADDFGLTYALVSSSATGLTMTIQPNGSFTYNAGSSPEGSYSATIRARSWTDNTKDKQHSVTITPAPDLTVTAAKIGTTNWYQSDTNKEIRVTVSNLSGAGATTAVITVTADNLPNAATLASISGTGWTGDVAQRKASTSVKLQPGQSSAVSLFYNIAPEAGPQVHFTGSVATTGEVNTSNNTYDCVVNIIGIA